MAKPLRRPLQQQTRLTDSQKAELISRYVAGGQAFRLAIEFGLHRATVASILVRADVRRPRLMTEQERAQAVELYAQGWTCKRIGEELGRSRDAVRLALHVAGIELQPGTRIKVAN